MNKKHAVPTKIVGRRAFFDRQKRDVSCVSDSGIFAFSMVSLNTVGKYSLGDAFGYEGDPGTKMDYRETKKTDVWVDDPDSNYYNTLQSSNKKDKDWNSAEDMNHELYGNGIEINYNESNTPGEGSAIFLHANDSYTVGCTATPSDSLKKIMQWADPSKDPVIVQTPESGLSDF